MFIIGLTGKAGCGKDTAAEGLQYHLNFHRFAFADPIKEMVATLLGVSVTKWEDREWKETPLLSFGVSPRRMAQTLGTEWGRSLDKDFWVKTLEHRLYNRASMVHHSRVVITDVRFDNEAEWIVSRGGIIIEVVRPGATAVEAHASELGIHPNLIDFPIYNNGTIQWFQDRIAIEVERKLNAQQNV